MTESLPDRGKYVLGDVSAHVGFLNCERISDRSHIHGWRVDEHYHEGLAQLFVFQEGRVEGRIDYAQCSIDGPAVAWMPALCNHSFVYPADMNGWVITVPTTNISRLVAQKPWLKGCTSLPLLVRGAEHAALLADALGWARRIEAEQARHSEESYAVLEALFFLALVTLHRAQATEGGQVGPMAGRKQDLLVRFQALLDQKPDATRSVVEYARMLAVTPTHLSRCIRASTGRTAGELIHDRVMLEAKRQLVFTDRSVADIAYNLGFSSPSYFSRFFGSRMDGETPRDFRARMRVSALV
ncbi:helix-turn-helix domain-containing protein [Roseomonas mucosa]|jgi:AraC family transcriptional regulator, transcriptional activator of pobA|uniref:helix-turn-helix domain-containing protein n=1 Tax=Roseomonas mucosa TaxID=207340 RepID=UPI00384B8A1A